MIYSSSVKAQLKMPQTGFYEIKQLGDYPLVENDRIWNMVFSTDGKELITVSDFLIRHNLENPNKQQVLWWPEKGTMCHAVFSKDRKMFARLENGTKIHIHDTATAKLLKTLVGRGSRSLAGAWGPQGKLFAAGGEGEVVLWSVETGELIKRIPHQKSPVYTLAISPDGKSVAAGNKDHEGVEGLLFIHRIDGSAAPIQLEHGTSWQSRSDLVFSPDGKTIAGPSDSNRRSRFCVWSVETGKAIHTYQGSYNRGVFSADGKWVAACGSNNIQVWDVQSGREIFRHQGGSINEHVWSLAFSPKGDVLAAGVAKHLRLIDTRSWRVIAPTKSHHTPVRAVSFSPDGKYLVSGCKQGRVVLWDWEKKKMVWVNDKFTHLTPGGGGKPEKPALRYSWGVEDISWSPDSSLIAVNASTRKLKGNRFIDPKKYHILDRETSNVMCSFGDGRKVRGNVLITPDNKTAYTGSEHGKVYEWRIGDGTIKRKIGIQSDDPSSGSPLTSLAFSIDSMDYIWWAGERQKIGLRRLSDGKDILILKSYSTTETSSIQVSPNNNWLTSDLTLWSLPKGEVVDPGRRRYSFRHSGLPHPSSLITAAVYERKAKFIDTLTWKPMREIDFGPGEILSITFSPDGKSLVAAGEFGIKYVDFKQLAEFKGLEKASYEQLWNFMGGHDAWFAYQASWVMAGKKDWLSFVAGKLHPAREQSQVELSRLRETMRDSDDQVALTAARLLLDSGVELSEKELLSLRRPDPSDHPHYHARISGTTPVPGVDYQPSLKPAPELLPLSSRLRSARAVMILEENGSPKAKIILVRLASGYEKSPLTRQALSAIGRLRIRQK